MRPSLIPFDEPEQNIIKLALAMLADVNFFERLVQDESLKAVNNFDSLPVTEQLSSIQRLSGTRSILLMLDQDSKALKKAQETEESEAIQTGDSQYVEESIFPGLGT